MVAVDRFLSPAIFCVHFIPLVRICCIFVVFRCVLLYFETCCCLFYPTAVRAMVVMCLCEPHVVVLFIIIVCDYVLIIS